MYHITLIQQRQLSATKYLGGIDSFDSFGEWIGLLANKDAPDNAIKYFANIGRSASAAASTVDTSSGKILTALGKLKAGFAGGLKTAWTSL